MGHIDMSRAMLQPTQEELTRCLSLVCADGLWKLGSCYEDQLDLRPHLSLIHI